MRSSVPSPPATRGRKRRWLRRAGVALLVVCLGGVYAGYRYRDLWRAEFAYRRQDWGRTRQHAVAHVEMFPRSQRALLLLARSARQLNDQFAAERAYAQLKAVPMADLRWLAVYYRMTGRGSRRQQTDKIILQRAPDDPDALLDLALIHQERREDMEAIRLAQRVTELAPDRVAAWRCLAELYELTAEPHKARDCLRKAVALNPPKVWDARKHLAHVLLALLADPVEAERQLKLALEAHPDDGEAFRLLAECHLVQGNLDAARDWLQRALQADRDDAAALLALANLELAQHNDWQAALGYVERVLKRAPSNVQARNLKTFCESLKAGGASLSVRNLQQSWRPIPPVTWQFTDVAVQWGVTFRNYSGENKERRYLPESFGSGVAIFDYDGDGLLDLYFINGKDLAPNAPPPAHLPRNELYRNLGNGRFEHVIGEAGLGDTEYGHGVAVGDYDNDGDQDVYVANYGPDKLYENNGDGTFRDVTVAAGVAEKTLTMSTSVAWFDYDEDGDLDLYVCNYSVYDVANPTPCTNREVGNVYCGPITLEPQRHTLYRNNGDGTFEDVTDAMGIGRNKSRSTMGFGLGIVAAYLDEDWNDLRSGDWHMDLFVANDTTPNFVFLGDGKRLIDVTEQSGAAFNSESRSEACMGVDAGDVDGDGDADIIVTNQWAEKNTLYRNERGRFLDATYAHGLGYVTREAVGWGTALIDFDNDGDLDNFVTNGHFYDWRPGQPMRQNAMLFANRGDGVFEPVSRAAGPYFQTPVIGRGAAFGDLDNDGDVDIAVNQWGDPCAVLRNDTKTEGAWIRLELVGVESNRDAVGTAVKVRVGTRYFCCQRKGGVSYLAANDPRLLIGLGAAEVVDSLEIRWPSGRVQQFPGLAVRQSYRLVEGQERW